MIPLYLEGLLHIQCKFFSHSVLLTSVLFRNAQFSDPVRLNLSTIKKPELFSVYHFRSVTWESTLRWWRWWFLLFFFLVGMHEASAPIKWSQSNLQRQLTKTQKNSMWWEDTKLRVDASIFLVGVSPQKWLVHFWAHKPFPESINIQQSCILAHRVLEGNSHWCPFVGVIHTKDSFSRDLN